MEKIIGIDLGTNSIGWAIRDTHEQENQIVDKGVLTFEKGVGEGKSGEFPLVQKRTESRSKRRNYQAEKYRKWALLKTLIEQKMCPLSIEELDEWRKYTKGVGRKYPQSEKFIQWLRFDFDGDGKPDFETFGFSKHENHYLFRMLAVSEEEQHNKIFENNPHILGRVLYHLVQRRGYRGRDDEGEEAKTIMKGSNKTGTTGVEVITPLIKEYKTLGAALYHLSKDKNERIRKRYNLRTDYEYELKAICSVQKINDLIYKQLWKAIVWQRPLRSQKGLVGYCTLEAPAKNESNKFIKAGKKRCPVSHPFYEEFRTWVFINNLKIHLPENVDKAIFLKENIYPLFYKVSKDFKLSSINKELKKVGGYIKSKHSKGEGKNKEDDTKVISCTLLNSLKDLLGSNWKDEYGWIEGLSSQSKKCPYSFEDIWHILFTFDSKEKLKQFAIEKLRLDEEEAEKFSKIKLQQGYATLSLSAIKKILPYLYQGFIYSEAVYLANLHKVLGAKEVTQDMIDLFSEEVRKIITEQNESKQLSNVINNLISDQLNSDQRYGMDANYELDADDKKDIEIKLQSVFGAKTWEEKEVADKQKSFEFVANNYLTFLRKSINAKKDNLFIRSARLHDKIFDYLKNTYDVPDENKKYLWHPSEQETYEEAQIKNGKPMLGKPQPISNGFKNPMALKTLHKLKGLMNYLLQTNKIDEDTRVVIEIARELNDANRRKAIEKYQRDREKENDGYKKRIEEIAKEYNLHLDINNKDIIDKYRLWIEQNETCLYTGKIIGCKEIFDGSLYDYEHTIPASMSFDNELKNLTIANGIYNKQIKQNKLPTQLPNYYEDAVINEVTYTAIKPRLEFIEIKVTELEKQLEDWKYRAKVASTKDRKDYCIQQRHLIRFDLDYWRKKIDTFTITEYKAGWRNSQLRDTQIVTKFALPYLKTVFKKVEVQKGSVTSAFREIYKIQPRQEKKDRTKHSHHAVDAAVLTLIPPAAIRDKILLRYNEEKDKNTNNTYHETPRQWGSFSQQHIISLEDEILINFQAQHRTLTNTKKNVRKRGKQQFVKEKTQDGSWHYKLDEDGNKIPLIAQGDTIRGQLHEESFMTLIKQPEYLLVNNKYIPSTDGKGNFIFQQKNEVAELFVVKKVLISELDTIDKLKKIIDLNLKDYLSRTIKERIDSGRTYQQAILEPIWAYGKSKDKNGNAINPIRHLRCRVAKAAGFLSKEKTLDIRKNEFVSKYSHKRDVLAGNDEMVICLFYQIENSKSFRLISRFELAALKIKNLNELYSQNEYNQILKGSKKLMLPLTYIIQSGCKVFLFDDKVNSVDDLKQLGKKELSRRLFIINNYNIPAGNTIYIYLINHIDSRTKDILQKEEVKNIDTTKYQAKLALTADKFNCAIEGKDFEMKPDGQIKWFN